MYKVVWEDTEEEQKEINYDRQFVAFFHFIDFYNISFGISLCLSMPNIEIHVPFGFFKIGWTRIGRSRPINKSKIFESTTWGKDIKWYKNG